MTTNYIKHYGILGQKWGVRRYQNPDGSLTEEGRKRYGTKENFEAARQARSEKLKKAGRIAGTVALSLAPAVAAGLLVGPTGGIVVSSIASAYSKVYSVGRGLANMFLSNESVSKLYSQPVKDISDMSDAPEQRPIPEIEVRKIYGGNVWRAH